MSRRQFQLGSATQSDPIKIDTSAIFTITGLTANSNGVTLQFSADGGTTWVDASSEYTADADAIGQVIDQEGMRDLRWRFNQGTYAGGTTTIEVGGL